LTHAHGQARRCRYRRGAVGLLAILVVAAGGAGCSRATAGRPAAGRPAAGGTGAGPSKALAYPLPPAVPFSYRLSAQPDSYEINYSHVLITLREHALFRLSFAVDPGHPDATAPLVAENKATGDREHWSMTPVTVDGGTGYRAEYPVNGETYLFYFFAKGSIAVTLKASLGKDGDDATRRDAEHIVNSLRFDATRLKGPYGGTHPAPAIPFTFDMPPTLAAASYPTQLVGGYFVNLRYGTQKVLVNDEITDNAGAAASTFNDRRNKIVASGATPHDVKTLPATASSLGRQVDEGFSVNINENGQPYLVGFVFRHGNQVVTLSTTVEGPRTQQTLQALQAPLDMAGSWTFTGT
jgi:hypothetical protein